MAIEEIIVKGRRINVGPLTSFNSLVYHLSSEFKKIREGYLRGETPEFYFDLTNIRSKSMHISAITALLCFGKKLSSFVGYPIPVLFYWDPDILNFLNSIEFFNISKKLQIFEFYPKGIVGGFRKEKYQFNPNSKIIYYADIFPIKDIDADDIGLEKAKHKSKIAGNFKLLCSSVLRGISSSLENKIANAALELIVNSLMHAEEIAFVGLLRTNRKIVVSICDAGIGFPKALSRAYKSDGFSNLTHAQGIFLGSLVQRREHGLRLAINELLTDKEVTFNNNKEDFGWVVISSYNTEIRWEKELWNTALREFEKIDFDKFIPPLESILGSKIESYIDKEDVTRGYWKVYDHFLVGTRISFEIILNQ
jgi:hypothetical protein